MIADAVIFLTALGAFIYFTQQTVKFHRIWKQCDRARKKGR